ncbi:MAG: hypothetical protein CEO19_409 [Parcubacteria group bacterium Gr01-1014_73]|nr:MAG: hypothetical protein CEO19_409 [Parcubacteria group bacterium Gr01-1014_73]
MEGKEKQFSIEEIKKTEGREYRTKLLNIINDIEKRVRVVEPDAVLHRELHEKRVVDSRLEKEDFKETRQDVIDSFGIADDPDHIYFFNDNQPIGDKEQRALRAFFIMIDTVRKEGFYGEGRIDHNTLFRKLVELASKFQEGLSFESVVEKTDTDPPQFLVFKGFLSKSDFKEISESSRKILETPIFDQSGQPIETAENWFITGHNLGDGIKTKDTPS